MGGEQQTDINLRLWADGDLPLLERVMGDANMTSYLGGPETHEEILKRHERYCKISDSGKGRVFVIVVGQDQVAAGSVAYWETEWQGNTIWEAGWSVLPEFQSRGIAAKGTALAVEQARAEKKHRFVHAFPSVENATSNGVCRKVGFTLQGEVEFEYHRVEGHFMRCNDWRFDLFADTPAS